MKSKVTAIANSLAAIIIIVIIIVAGVGIYYSSTLSSGKTTTVVSSATTTPTALIPISIALATPAQFSQLDIFIAQQEGFFAQNGLKVTLDEVQGAPPMFAALTSGSTQFAAFGWTDVVNLYLHGEPVQSVFDFNYAPGFILEGNPGSPYTSIASLQGQNVGVAAPDLTQFLMMAIFNDSGYNPNTFAHFVYVGIGGSAYAAVKAGTVVAALQSTPFAIEQLEDGNASQVFNMASYPVADFAAPLLDGLSGYMAANPGIVHAMVKSLLEAAQYVHSNEAGTLALCSKIYQGVPAAALQTMYTNNVPMMPANGTAPLTAFKAAWALDLEGNVVNSTTSFTKLYQATVNDTYITQALG